MGIESSDTKIQTTEPVAKKDVRAPSKEMLDVLMASIRAGHEAYEVFLVAEAEKNRR